MNWTAAAACLLLMSAAVQAGTQTVYRCGPGGREYSQTPCPAGREVPVADPRGADQQRDGQVAAAKDARLAKELAAERREREREAAARGQGPAAIKPAASAVSPGKDKPEKKREKRPKQKRGKKSSDTADWRATSPRKP